MRDVWTLLVSAVPAVGCWLIARRAMGPQRTGLAVATAAYAVACLYGVTCVTLVFRTSGGIARAAAVWGWLALVLALVAVIASVCSLAAREPGSRWTLIPLGLSVAGIALSIAAMVGLSNAL